MSLFARYVANSISGGGGSGGTVTSVAMTVPSFLSIAGSPITTSGTLALTLSGTALPIANGGTGQTTASAAFNALSPITTAGDLIIGNGVNSAARLAIGANATVLTSNGTTASWQAVAGTGTVTSVALADGSSSPIYAISGSPVTGSGTLTFTLSTQSANRVFAGPTTGSAAQPTFRALVAADLPAGTGTVTSVSVVSANGLAGTVATATSTPAITLSTTINAPVLAGNGTAISAATTTGSGSTVVLNSAPTMTNPVVGTQSQGDTSTKAASTAYVDIAISNAVAGINPAVAVQAATTAAGDTSAFTYNNGASGVGATFTGAVNTALIVDGYTFTALGQRLLVKNDTQSPSGAFNGVYYVTQVQTAILPLILTRALDYNTPSDMNNTGAIPVINGTVNGTTSWVQTALIVTVGTTPLTFVKFTRNPADYLLVANNLSDVASKATSFNNVSPVTTTGDIIYSASGATNSRLAIGSTGNVLTVSGGVPSWAPPATSGTVTSVAASGPSGIATWSAAITGSGTLTQTLSTQSAGTFLAGPTSGSAATPSFRALQAPTIQKFTSGSGTYTTAAGALYIRVRIVGGGGGGGPGGATLSTNGGNGGTSTFGSSMFSCTGGTGGTSAARGGAGGTGSLGTGPIGTIVTGGDGGSANGSISSNQCGGNGGSSFFGGGGAGGFGGGGGANAGVAYGSGGGGGGSNTNSAGVGGAAGGYADGYISSPAATYSYTYAVGAAGISGTGTGAGAAGAPGYIEVTEYYQ